MGERVLAADNDVDEKLARLREIAKDRLARHQRLQFTSMDPDILRVAEALWKESVADVEHYMASLLDNSEA